MQTHWLSDIYTCNITGQLHNGETHVYAVQAAGDYILAKSQPRECAISFTVAFSSAINIAKSAAFSENCQPCVDNESTFSVIPDQPLNSTDPQ